eukprot:TRINITY_DN29464_c0_g1_i1.p1 TRINITY_DN29464_c0_g1~~TRINITY_DN29464_c0_g1_i1.p1  ORF type:complete len:1167 (-),score=137.59 TRINITY_DN29464_c0_g1_i1:37-3537(-)
MRPTSAAEASVVGNGCGSASRGIQDIRAPCDWTKAVCLPNKISPIPGTLTWSHGHHLAIMCDDIVHIVDVVAALEKTQEPKIVGCVRLSSFIAPSPFNFQPSPLPDVGSCATLKECARLQKMLTASKVHSFVCVAWSPHGCGLRGGPLLAVADSHGLVIVYGLPSHCWEQGYSLEAPVICRLKTAKVMMAEDVNQIFLESPMDTVVADKHDIQSKSPVVLSSVQSTRETAKADSSFSPGGPCAPLGPATDRDSDVAAGAVVVSRKENSDAITIARTAPYRERKLKRRRVVVSEDEGMEEALTTPTDGSLPAAVPGSMPTPACAMMTAQSKQSLVTEHGLVSSPVASRTPAIKDERVRESNRLWQSVAFEDAPTRIAFCPSLYSVADCATEPTADDFPTRCSLLCVARCERVVVWGVDGSAFRPDHWPVCLARVSTVPASRGVKGSGRGARGCITAVAASCLWWPTRTVSRASGRRLVKSESSLLSTQAGDVDIAAKGAASSSAVIKADVVAVTPRLTVVVGTTAGDIQAWSLALLPSSSAHLAAGVPGGGDRVGVPKEPGGKHQRGRVVTAVLGKCTARIALDNSPGASCGRAISMIAITANMPVPSGDIGCSSGSGAALQLIAAVHGASVSAILLRWDKSGTVGPPQILSVFRDTSAPAHALPILSVAIDPTTALASPTGSDGAFRGSCGLSARDASFADSVRLVSLDSSGVIVWWRLSPTAQLDVCCDNGDISSHRLVQSSMSSAVPSKPYHWMNPGEAEQAAMNAQARTTRSVPSESGAGFAVIDFSGLALSPSKSLLAVIATGRADRTTHQKTMTFLFVAPSHSPARVLTSLLWSVCGALVRARKADGSLPLLSTRFAGSRPMVLFFWDVGAACGLYRRRQHHIASLQLFCQKLANVTTERADAEALLAWLRSQLTRSSRPRSGPLHPFQRWIETELCVPNVCSELSRCQLTNALLELQVPLTADGAGQPRLRTWLARESDVVAAQNGAAEEKRKKEQKTVDVLRYWRCKLPGLRIGKTPAPLSTDIVAVDAHLWSFYGNISQADIIERRLSVACPLCASPGTTAVADAFLESVSCGKHVLPLCQRTLSPVFDEPCVICNFCGRVTMREAFDARELCRDVPFIGSGQHVKEFAAPRDEVKEEHEAGALSFEGVCAWCAYPLT